MPSSIALFATPTGVGSRAKPQAAAKRQRLYGQPVNCPDDSIDTRAQLRSLTYCAVTLRIKG